MAESPRVKSYRGDSDGRKDEIADLRAEQEFIGEYRVGPEANQRLAEIREKLAELLGKRGEK